MSRAEWALIETARARALAERYEKEARDAATAAGYPPLERGHYSYALGWLAHHAARRHVEVENARLVHDAQAAAAPSPHSPQRGGGSPLRLVDLDESDLRYHHHEPRCSRR